MAGSVQLHLVTDP
ncbi:Protein of unknown function [Bacillus mycoides]|nr:Protein of unknown function [Bacillus mycoides]